MASRADKMASGVNFSNFGKATDLKSRIWFTIGALIVFRLLSFVPLPGVDPVAQAALYANNAAGGVLDIFNTFAGGSLEAGGAWNEYGDITLDSLIPAGSLFLGVDTPLGPLYMGAGYAEGGNTSLYLSLGKLF